LPSLVSTFDQMKLVQPEPSQFDLSCLDFIRNSTDTASGKPVAFIEVSMDGFVEQPLAIPCRAKYVHISPYRLTFIANLNFSLTPLSVFF